MSVSSIIIDVRSAAEFATGHVTGAINIPYDQIARAIGLLADVDKAHPIIVYCRSGARSAVAASILGELGYTQVVNGGALSSLLMQINSTMAKAANQAPTRSNTLS